MPPTNSRDPPQQPPSPSPDLHKRRRLQPAHDTQLDTGGTERRMSIDEVTAQNEQGQTKARANAEDARANKDPNSRGALNGNNTDPQPCDTGMDTELNDADVEEILATLETASEIKQTEAMLNAPNLLDKYTDAEMPPIFSDSPAGLLEGIEKQQARKWILNATGKVLAVE